MYFLKLNLILFSTIFISQAQKTTIYDFTLKAPKEKSIRLSKYKGKPILIINIATRCGYTGQLDDIEKLHKKYHGKGLEIIGIPSNDFGGQTPESNQEVVEMCRMKYGATFPIAAKSSVLGEEKIPLIKFILRSSNGSEIKWNFEKFLFNKQGNFIKRFDSSTLPLDSKLEKEIIKAL